MLSEEDRAELVQRLLAGARVDPDELGRLGYEIETWHLGMVASGTKATEVLQDLKTSLGRELLLVLDGGTVWAWLGGSRQVAVADVERVLSRSEHMDVSLAIGEPGRGIDGWRLTHHQAQEAYGLTMRRPQRITWYADNPLLAAAVGNDTLAMSLKQKYGEPLRTQRDGGVALRRTLRAYIDAGCVVTSAAPVLGVRRHTVASHVSIIERLIGRRVRACLSELDVALRLEELGDLAQDHRSPTTP
jgi:sugar diacid utilization regulator